MKNKSWAKRLLILGILLFFLSSCLFAMTDNLGFILISKGIIIILFWAVIIYFAYKLIKGVFIKK